jgi:poly(3-hydroxybutyrate) depolymerase
MNRMLRRLAAFVPCLCLGAGSYGAVSVNDFVPRTFTNSFGLLPYRLYIPTNYNRGVRYPLVLFLHGAGERGSDNRAQLAGQTGPLVFVTATNQARHPSLMVAPQCPSGGTWNDATRRGQVAGLMTALIAEFSLDTNRLYITGLSMGGYGTWDYMGRFPGFYAAAIPMNGGGTAGLAGAMTRMPIWNFHAVNDSVVSVIESRNMVAAVRRAGGNIIYTEYSNGDHGIWTPAYATPVLLEWLYSQRLGLTSTNAPLVQILAPTEGPVFSSDGQPLRVSGIATDGSTGPSLVTWTNLTAGGAEIARGIATGGTAWQLTNTAWSATVTNRLCVVGRGTSWYAPWGGSTTFNDTLQIIFPPVILTQPAGRQVNERDQVTLSVGVASLGTTPAYQWRRNGTDLINRTDSVLVLGSVLFADGGSYSVRIRNSFGETLSGEALLTVNRLPVVHCANRVIPAGLDCRAEISVDAGSFDPDGETITLAQFPPGPYPVGPSQVTLLASDSRGGSNACQAIVTVLDQTPPQIICPPDIRVTNAHDQVSAVVSFSPAVSDNCAGVGSPICNPASGSAFAAGLHTVTCSAIDFAGNSSQCSFVITVVPGNLPPVPIVHISPLARFSGYTNLLVISPNNRAASIGVDASGSYDVDDAAFRYEWSEGDERLGTNATLVHDFSLGEHTLTLALDDRFPGGISSTNLTIEVISAADAVGILIETLQASALSFRNQRPLVASLSAASASFQRGNFDSGINQLKAFANKVSAQILPSEPVLGAQLVSAAEQFAVLIQR